MAIQATRLGTPAIGKHQMSEQRIWIGCLAAYNAGKLHGEWFDVTGAGEDEVHENAAKVLRESPIPNAEEAYIADTEGFDGFFDGEPSVHQVITALELISALTDDDIDLAHWAAYSSIVGSEYADIDGFNDAFAGVWDSELDYAYEMADEFISDADDSILARYFDYEAFRRDLFMTDVTRDDDTGCVFRDS